MGREGLGPGATRGVGVALDGVGAQTIRAGMKYEKYMKMHHFICQKSACRYVNFVSRRNRSCRMEFVTASAALLLHSDSRPSYLHAEVELGHCRLGPAHYNRVSTLTLIIVSRFR